MAVAVVAFPTISAKDLDWIQSYRKDHDALYYDVIAPHFTLVFPVADSTTEAFIQEIETRAKGITPILFELQKAMVNKDAFKDAWHEFLVPVKGYGAIVALHDQLYSGSLIVNLRTDIPYIPHIGAGNTKSLNASNQRVDDLNARPFSIAGRIKTLTVISYLDNKVTVLKEISLL